MSKILTIKGDFMATLADAIPNDECFGIEDLAEEFGVGTLRMRQVLQKALSGKIVPNLSKKDGRKILYAPQMVEALKDARDKGKLGKFNKKSGIVSTKHAQLVVSVPIFDPEIANLLKSKFENEAGMSKFLKNMLETSVKSIMGKKREIQERYERELEKLYSTSDLSM